MGGTRGTRALALALVFLAVSSSCASAKSATAPSAVHLTSDGADAEIGKMTDDAEFAAIERHPGRCRRAALRNGGARRAPAAAGKNYGIRFAQRRLP